MTVRYQFWAFLRRDYLLASSPRFAWVWQVGSIVFAVPTLYYLGRLVQPAASPHLAAFGSDYFAFVILGVAMATFLSATLTVSGAALQREGGAGTLEALLAMPTSPLTLVLASSCWHILIAAGQAAFYLALAGAVFGLNLSHANLLSAAVVLLIATSTFLALGILSASFVLLFRQPDPVLRVFAGASALLAGVFYPPSVLPPLLQYLGQFIPLTYALRALRLALLRGYAIGELKGEVGVLLAFLAVSMSLATVVLPWAVRQAKHFGTLTWY